MKVFHTPGAMPSFKDLVIVNHVIFIAFSKSLISPLISAVISLTGLLFDLTMTSIKNLLLQTHLNQIIKSYFNVSVSKPSTLYRTVRTMATLTVHHLLLNFPVYQFSSVEKANQYCDFMRTILDKHAPNSLRKKQITTPPWFESIRDELLIAKRERCQAERNTKLTILKNLYRQEKHKISKLVHLAKCKFYTERIALASSSKELLQIVNTLSNRHPPKILPTIYPSADLLSLFIKHFTNKVKKLRANIASVHVTSTLVTGTTTATFSSFEKVSQLTVKECILNCSYVS